MSIENFYNFLNEIRSLATPNNSQYPLVSALKSNDSIKSANPICHQNFHPNRL